MSLPEKVIVIGASTGGTDAIRNLLASLPGGLPGILIAQHMPESFTRTFAERLNQLCRFAVKEAQHGEPVLAGHAYVAPGHSHLLLARQGGAYRVVLSQDPPLNFHRPSVDLLFRSAARWAGKQAIGILLTGMGKDGAAGLLEMHRAGAWTFAQDEASSVVFGMPREAIALGAVDEVVPIRFMAAHLLARLERKGAGEQ
jgi:two-component system chemotaxis response regulator CheB